MSGVSQRKNRLPPEELVRKISKTKKGEKEKRQNVEIHRRRKEKEVETIVPKQ